jgi:hypothetical protein
VSTEVLRVAANDDAVDVTARGPDGATTTIRAPYVVGCDGAHSTVRDELGLRFDGHDYANDWLLADVALDWDRAPDEVYIVLNAAGRAAVFMPLPAGRWRVVLYFAGDRAENLAPTLDEVAELVSQRMPGVGVSDPSWLAAFRTTRRSAAAYRRGRALLAGDAVHVHSPAGGQGLNTGLLEAQNLGWKLAAVATGAASADLLDSYEAERAPVAREILALSHNLVRLTALSRPWERVARNTLLPLVTRHSRVRSRAVRRISQLYVDYRSSPLTVADGKAGRPRGPRLQPGDRAPDARLRSCGRQVRLHEVLRGTGHTLLVVEPASGQAVPPRLDRYAAQFRMVLILAEERDEPVCADRAVDVAGDVAEQIRTRSVPDQARRLPGCVGRGRRRGVPAAAPGGRPGRAKIGKSMRRMRVRL